MENREGKPRGAICALTTFPLKSRDCLKIVWIYGPQTFFETQHLDTCCTASVPQELWFCYDLCDIKDLQCVGLTLVNQRPAGSHEAVMMLYCSNCPSYGKWLHSCEMGWRWDQNLWFHGKSFWDIIGRCDWSHRSGRDRELTAWEVLLTRLCWRCRDLPSSDEYPLQWAKTTAETDSKCLL